MKKSLIITLALVFVLGIASTAFAAVNPFVDVPAKHWSYDAVQKLVNAGVVSGYGDNTFRGDKTLTRYEMAVTVAKAMANSEKANAENKAIIDKLAVEFQAELAGLNVRVTKLENKVGNIKFTGEIRERYERSANTGAAGNNPVLRTRFRLSMKADLTDDLAFVGRYHAEDSVGGVAATTNLDQAYLTGKAFGLDTFRFGRMPLFLGKGLIMDNSQYNDGILIGFGNQFKVTLGSTKSPTGLAAPTTANVVFGNLGYAVSKEFDLTASYLKDKDSAAYKTWAAGFGYKGIKNIGVTFEYGRNTSTAAKASNANSAAKAWMAQAKYLGADKAKDNSYGFWVGYRNADRSFAGNISTVDLSAYSGTELSNIKGFEYGFEYTAFKNGILLIQYNDIKTKTTNASAKNVIAQLTYNF